MNMFSSYSHLKRKTPEQGIYRQEYIGHLVEEYYTTTNVEAQEQVTANLANFAYDPINWEYLKAADVLKLFIELLDTPNENLQLYGSAGLCNICFDQEIHHHIVKEENIKKIKNLLIENKNPNITLNILTLFYQLLSHSVATKSTILCASTLKQIKSLNFHYENDKRIVNITSLLLEEFGKRYELVEVVTKLSTDDPTVNELERFSQLTGDFNYIHSVALPQEKRKVHGALLNAVVAGIIGTKFPGAGSIVLEQTFSFPKPCRIEVNCEFTLKVLRERKISIISYECRQNNVVVFQGQAKLLINDIRK